MFELSAGELFMVLIVATLVLGPARAANLMRRIARWLESADSRWSDFVLKSGGEDEPR